MRRFAIAFLAAFLAAACAANAQGFFAPADSAHINAAKQRALHEPIEALTNDVEHLHPIAMFFLAKRLSDAGRMEDALFWFYEGQLRWRAHLAMNKDQMEADEYERLFSDIGPDINKFAARHIPIWLATIDKVLAWDTAHPDDFTPPGDDKNKSREGLAKFKDYIVAHKDEITQKAVEEDKQEGATADDPYAGSGGALLGTPAEMLRPYDPDQFKQFQVGKTKKNEVVAALGKPEWWGTDKDGTSVLGYSYKWNSKGLSVMGMSQTASVSFKFDAQKVLMEIDLPKNLTP